MSKAPSLAQAHEPIESDPVALALDVWAAIDEAPNGKAWTGEAGALAARLRDVLSGYGEGEDPCVCRHAYNRHENGDGCDVPRCPCKAYAPPGFDGEACEHDGPLTLWQGDFTCQRCGCSKPATDMEDRPLW